MLTRVLLCLVLALAASSFSAGAEDEMPTLGSVLAAVDDSTVLEGRVVYLDFWASWCAPCRTSFPWMREMLEAHGEEGLSVVTVNVDRKPESAQRFLEEVGADLPVIYDPAGKLAEQFALQVMPTAFVFDRAGTLKVRHEGFRPKDADSLELLLVELLAEDPAGSRESTPEASTTREMAP